MKKFNKFELSGVGIFLLIFCIFISLIGKKVFDLDGDYLSAAATLFAAVIAAILYNDWKDQHGLNLLDKYHNELKLLKLYINNNRSSIKEGFNNFFNSTSSYMPLDDFTRIKINNLNEELGKLESTLNEYLIFLNNIKNNNLIRSHKKSVMHIQNELFEVKSSILRINNLPSRKFEDEMSFSVECGSISNFINIFNDFSEVALPNFYFKYFNIQD